MLKARLTIEMTMDRLDFVQLLFLFFIFSFPIFFFLMTMYVAVKCSVGIHAHTCHFILVQ